MSMDYWSDEIFSVPPGEVVARASAEGMIWVLLGYLQEWCSNNAFCSKGVSVLVEIYRTLGCYANCWFLSKKYLPAPGPAESGNSAWAASLGLDIGVTIVRVPTRFQVVGVYDMWAERDLIIKHIKNDPRSLSHWLQLALQYVDLEELLMAVMTLFLIRMNTVSSEAIGADLEEYMHYIRLRGECASIWALVAEESFVSRAVQILMCHRAREEIADLIGKLFASSFDLSLNGDDLLRPFVWPK